MARCLGSSLDRAGRGRGDGKGDDFAATAGARVAKSVRELAKNTEIAYLPSRVPSGRGANGAVTEEVAHTKAGLVRGEKRISGQRFEIDYANKEGVLCQNGTMEGPLGSAGAPPFPLRAPSVSPPCPHRGLALT